MTDLHSANDAVATTVLAGDAAYLVATQAELLTEALGCEIRRLKTPDLRIGIYDPVRRRLVIFDGAALAAIARAEIADVPSRGAVSAPTHAGLDRIFAIDPPSRL